MKIAKMLMEVAPQAEEWIEVTAEEYGNLYESLPSKEKPDLRCVECEYKAKYHKEGGLVPKHFEHYPGYSRSCSLSYWA